MASSNFRKLHIGTNNETVHHVLGLDEMIFFLLRSLAGNTDQRRLGIDKALVCEKSLEEIKGINGLVVRNLFLDEKENC